MESNNAIKSIDASLNISFIILVIFIFFRPLTLVFMGQRLFGLNILEYFSMVFSYFLIIPVLLKIRKIKLDSINLIIIIYCIFVSLSVLWGSDIREIARMILPFVLFFFCRIYLTEKKQVKILFVAAILGFIYPILGSLYSILIGSSLEKVVWSAGHTKFGGLYGSIHPFAHSMLLFIFLYAFITSEETTYKTLFNFCSAILSFIALYCIYKTHVRTVYLGFLIFSVIYLWNINKKYFYIFVIVVLSLLTLNLPQVENIFWQKPQKQTRTFDSASSGRLTTWEHNLKAFSRYSLEQKIAGVGLGGEGETVIEGKILVEPSHNDYISLLMTIGPIGLFLYLLLFATLIKNIYLSNASGKLKYWFLAIAISVLIMNFVSNGYIFRVELSQYFWLIMGTFYSQQDMSWTKHKADGEKF